MGRPVARPAPPARHGPRAPCLAGATGHGGDAVSSATLTTSTVPGHEPPIVQLVIDCPHGTTTSRYRNAVGGYQLTPAQVTRATLARHYQEERCRCIRKLWREHFGMPLGEVPLAVGAPCG